MSIPDHDPDLRVLKFNPHIKGLKRYFHLRALEWEGSLWLLSQDAETALGWHYGSLTSKLASRLPGDAWGYAHVLTENGRKLLRFVSVTGLRDSITRLRERQSRAFQQWLCTL